MSLLLPAVLPSVPRAIRPHAGVSTSSHTSSQEAVRALPSMLFLHLYEASDTGDDLKESYSFAPTKSGLKQAIEKMEEVAESWDGDYEKETFWRASLVSTMAEPSAGDKADLDPIPGQIAWLEMHAKNPVKIEKKTHERFLKQVRR